MPFLSGQEQRWGKELVHARKSGSYVGEIFPTGLFLVFGIIYSLPTSI